MRTPLSPPAALRVRSLVLIAAASILCTAPQASEARDLVGTATVVSADTIEIDGTHIRLWGIRGPAVAQVCLKEDEEWPCGRHAADYLREIIGGQPVSCTEKVIKSDAPVVALCTVGHDDLALRMTLAGFALARRDQSTAYVELEGVASRQRRGLWSGDFMLLWDHFGLALSP